MNKITITLAFALIVNFVIAQVNSVDKLDAELLNWYNKDYPSTGILGTSVDKAYEFISTNNKKGKTIIVAVIDSGVDINHEDLKGKIWVNEDEIPGNGIDDDGNGYIDDIHGWNFLGNAAGENIKYENYGYTRFVRENDPTNPSLPAAKKMYTTEIKIRKKEQKNLEAFKKKYNKSKSTIKSKLGITVNSAKDLSSINSTDEQVLAAKQFLLGRYSAGFTDDLLKNLIKRNEEFLKYYLNFDFKPREIIGDNPTDIADKFYGNPDVKGPRSNHGTSTAGVIAAIRKNNLGIDGIATDVKIMSLRAIPNGDERDKDVALSIYYAVDNGAHIINMSFGKLFSPEKKFVDEAAKYAEQKGVLLVHASGNGGDNIDIKERYPSDQYEDKSQASHWLNIGATSRKADKNVAANFSNYGKNHVDLSAPVVSGIAALVLSYYPHLKPAELIDILLESSFQLKKPRKIFRPALTVEKKKKKIKFAKLSKSGGVVNAYQAFLETEKRK